MATIVPPCQHCGKTALGCNLNRKLNRPVWSLIHRAVA